VRGHRTRTLDAAKGGGSKVVHLRDSEFLLSSPIPRSLPRRLAEH
jgi:hypothetical protein